MDCKTPLDCLQAPLSMGFLRQEYWSGLPCPPLTDLPDPGIEPCMWYSWDVSATVSGICGLHCYTTAARKTPKVRRPDLS